MVINNCICKWRKKERISFFFLWDWGLNSGLTLHSRSFYHLSHTSSPYFSGYFGDGVLQTICPGWPQTKILPISVLQAARITDVSHQWPTKKGRILTSIFCHGENIGEPKRSCGIGGSRKWYNHFKTLNKLIVFITLNKLIVIYLFWDKISWLAQAKLELSM
jgi:hypothetical protein